MIPSSVEVETVDGMKYVEQVRYSKGTASNPFTEEDLKEKFVILSAQLFDQRRIEEIIETVETLDKLDDISLLMRLLSKK